MAGAYAPDAEAWGQPTRNLATQVRLLRQPAWRIRENAGPPRMGFIAGIASLRSAGVSSIGRRYLQAQGEDSWGGRGQLFRRGRRLPESTEGSRGSPQIIDACFVFVVERSVVVFSDLLKGKRIFLDSGIAIATR